ncbi:MAG: hypothetical protein KC646_14275 [Candidatus Cloacimonetes bacterium]|nr:hypothetical protein [Candidatus Cloacimonadota bacterium]
MNYKNFIINTINLLNTMLLKSKQLFATQTLLKNTAHFCCTFLFILFCSVPYGATSQVIEFSGSVVHPADGPYNQIISIRVEIIKRVLDISQLEEGQSPETIVWSKTFEEVQIHNGQYSLIFDEDDQGVEIGAAVFETKLEYEYKTQAEVDRANLPNGNYALRFYMRRTINEDWEQIKPDFNIDSSPYSVSALKLSGADTKTGNLIIQATPKVEDGVLVTGAVLTIDTKPDDTQANQLAAGFYLENGTLNISMGTTNNKAIDMEGSLYLKDSVLEVEETFIVTEGNLFFERLCMSLNCEADAFKNILRANKLVLTDNFIDNGSTEEHTYNLNLGGMSHFQSLSIMNLSTGINGSLHMKGGADIQIKNYAGMRVNGVSASVNLLDGNITMDSSGELSNIDSTHFKLGVDNKLNENEIDNYGDPQYFKLSASKLRPSSEGGKTSPYFVKPSSTSNFKALQFHFRDKGKARLRLNARVSAHRFTSSASKHFVNAIFDPVITEEIYNSLVSGDLFDFHNHDLISQASEEELMAIINSSEFTDSKTIDLEFIDSSLMKETFDNVWPKQTYFYGLIPDNFDKDLFSSLKVRENIEVSAGNPDIAQARVVFGGVQHTDDTIEPFVDSSYIPRKSFGIFGTRSSEKRDIVFLYKNKRLDVKAGGLTLDQQLKLVPADNLSSKMTIYGELSVDGDLNIDNNMTIDGALISGCFGLQNVTIASSIECMDKTTLAATHLSDISTLTATIYTDRGPGNDGSKRFVNPNEHSIVENIEIHREFSFSGNTNIDAPIEVTSDFNAEIGTIGTTDNYIASQSFFTIVEPQRFKFDPNGTSILSDLDVSENVDIRNDFITSSNNKLVTLSSSIYTTSMAIKGVTTLDNGFATAQNLIDYTNATRFLDPSVLTEANSLQLDGDLTLSGNSTINGDLDVNTGMITIGRNLDFNGVVRNASNIIDINNPNYSVDPNQVSSFNQINIQSQLKSSYLTAKNVSILNNLTVGQDSFFDQNLIIDKQTEIYSRLVMPATSASYVPECRMNADSTLPNDLEFCVTNQGVIYARSAHFTDNVTVNQAGDFDGTVTVLGRVDIHSPTWFQELHLHLNDIDSTFSIQDQSLTTVFSIDPFGNTSSTKGGLRSTGSIRFLADSAKALLMQTHWTFATENSNIRHIRFQKSDGTLLHLDAQNLLSLSTAAGSLNFEIAQSSTLQKYIDSQNGLHNETFSIVLSETAVLNQMTVNDTQAVTQILSPIVSPDLSDLDDTNYFINLSSQSRLQDLSVDQELILRDDLRIFPDVDNYQTKISINDTSSSSPYMVLSADDYFSIDRLGNLSSNLDFLHHGQLEIVNSQLNLGIGTSTYSIGHLTMTTLIIHPGVSFNPNFQSNFPLYFADHLHTHDTIANVHISQMARKDLENIFTGENRFVDSNESILLTPGASSPSSWLSTSTVDLQRHFPWVLPNNGSFLVAHGYDDIDLSNSNTSVLNFSTQTSNFSNITNNASLSFKHLGLSFDESLKRLYVTGGLNGVNPSTQLHQYTVSSNIWNSSAVVPKPLLYHQSLSFDDEVYLFGGYVQSNGMMYPMTQSFAGEVSGITEFSSNFPAHQQMLEEALVYVRANSIYRNNLAKSDERLIYTHGSNIHNINISKNNTDICFHDDSRNLHTLDLVLDQVTALGVGHHCQWGQGNDKDFIYYISGATDYGTVSKIQRDGAGQSTFSVETGKYGVRDLHINSDNSVSMIAKVTMMNLSGEALLIKQSDNSVIKVDSDDTDESSFMSSGDDFHDLIVKNNQIFSLSMAKAHNSKVNLFASLSDGSDTTQVSFFPQGISHRPIILDSQEAIVAVTAFATLNNKLPLSHEQNCSAYYQDKLYLFGSGASDNQIQEYDSIQDNFYTLTETLPFNTPFSCSYDQTDKVYFQSGQTFWYFSLLEKKFWPIGNILGTTPSTQGALVAHGASVYFMDYQTSSNSGLLEYSVGANNWTAKLSPGFAYDQSSLISKGSELFLIGNKNGIYNQKFATGSNTWSQVSTQASVAGTNAHNITLLNYDNDHILLIGGANSSGTTSTLILYNVTNNTHQNLSTLKSNIANAGAFYNQHQLYLFGGEDNNRDLSIHPVNAISPSSFQQIYSLNLNSGSKTWLSSTPRFAHADLSSNENFIAYSSDDFGINLYDMATKSHSSIRASTSGTPVTNLSFAKDNDYLYFSQDTSTSQEVLRITSDGLNLYNVSNQLLNGTTGTIQFISHDHQRVYFIKEGKPYYSQLNADLVPVLFKNISNVKEITYHSSSIVNQKRDGILVQSPDTSMAPLTDTYFDELVLREVLKVSSGDYYFSAKAHFDTTNIYRLQAGKTSPQSITNLSGTTYAKNPFVSPFDNKLYYTKVNSGTPELVQYQDGVETALGLSTSQNLIGQNLFQAKNHKNLSFKAGNRFYTLVKQKIYRSQVLNSTPQSLTWTLFDELPQIDNNHWQITQYKNKAYFFDEDSKKIYQYYPEDKSLNFVSQVSTSISSGTLAVTSDTFYFIGNGSIAQLSKLANPSQLESVQVFSSNDSNIDSSAQKVFSFDPYGNTFARQMIGNANFTDQTISGGKGDHGILDESLSLNDIANTTITGSKIIDLSFENRHILDNNIYAKNIKDKNLLGLHFNDSVVLSSKLSTSQINTRHLAISTIQSLKLSDGGFTDADFADRSIQTDHISTNTISTTVIKDRSLYSSNFRDQNIESNDILDFTMATKQILNGSVQDIDIDTQTLITRHFQESSATTQKLSNYNILTEKITDFVLKTEKFEDFTIETSDIAFHTITGSLLVSEALTSGHLLDHTSGLSTANLMDLLVTKDKIADDAVDDSKVDTDSIASIDIETLSITYRELSTGSIDSNVIMDFSLVDCQLTTWSSNLPGNCTSSVLKSDAVTIGKLADLTLGTIDISNNSIFDRHFFSGGYGQVTTFGPIDFNSRTNPVVAIFENEMLVFGGGHASAQRINLTSKTSHAHPSLDGLSNEYAYIYDQDSIQFFGDSLFYTYDYPSDTLTTYTSATFTNSNDYSAKALSHKGEFYFIGGAGSHSNDAHKLKLDEIVSSYTNVSNLPSNMSQSSSVKFGSQVYLYGGYNGSASDKVISFDGSSFTDAGVSLPSALFGHQSVVHGGTVYISGGDTGAGFSDVVYSAGDAQNFTSLGATLPTGPITNHTMTVFNGRIFILGGETASGRTDEVHSSTDGITWTRHSRPPWSPRKSHQTIVFQNRLWLIGGDSLSGLSNEIYSTGDGDNWIQHNNGSFSARAGHHIVKNEEFLILTGGNYSDDTFTSRDGFTWKNQSSSSFTNVSDHQSASLNSKIYLFGGRSAASTYLDQSKEATLNPLTVTTLAPLPNNFIGTEHVSHQNNIYLFGDDSVWVSTNDGSSWTVDLSGFNIDFTGCSAHSYNGDIYVFGGDQDKNMVYRFVPGVSITPLSTFDFAINSDSGTNQVVLYQHRFYIPSSSATLENSLILWHPNLDASVAARNIDDAGIQSNNLKMNSLASMNFSSDSFISDNIIDGTITNIDIKDNSLSDHAIADSIFTGEQFKEDSITSSKIASYSVDSRVIADQTLIDSDFDLQSIDSRVLAINSIGFEEIIDFSITSDKLKNESITLSKLTSESVHGEDIVTHQIKTVDLADESIDNRVIEDFNILSTHILNRDLKSRHFQNNSVSRVKVKSYTLENSDISAEAIDFTSMFINRSIQARHIQDFNITNSKVSTATAHQLTNSRFLSNSLTSDDINDLAIKTYHLSTSSIIQELIKTHVLLDRSFAASALHTHHLMDDSLRDEQFLSNTIDYTSFALSTITSDQILDRSIHGEHLISWTLRTEDFKDNSIGLLVSEDSIDSIEILYNSLLSEDFANDSITTRTLSNASILGSHIATVTTSIHTDKVADLQITTRKIKPSSIITEDFDSAIFKEDKFLNETISSKKIALNQLDSANIKDKSIAGEFLQTNTIITASIEDSSISSRSIASYQIITRIITNQSVLAEHIDTDAVSYIKLATNTGGVFKSEHFIDGTISGDSIINYSLSHNQLFVDAVRKDIIQTGVISQFAIDDINSDVDSSIGINLGKLGNSIRLNSGEVFLVQDGSGTVQKLSPPNYDTLTALGNNACTNAVDAIYFFNDKTGYAACSVSFDIMYTSDGGVSWAKTDTAPGKVKDIHFFSQTEGVLVLATNPNEIYYSVSSGRNWTFSHSGSNALLPWVIHEDTIYTTNLTANEFLVSHDRGQSFTTHTDLFFINEFQSLSYNPDNGNLYAIVNNLGMKLYTSVNDGATWTQISFDAAQQTAFDASSPQGLIALGNYIYIATNDSNSSMWRYDLVKTQLKQFVANFEAVRLSSIPHNSDLNPTYLSEGRFLVTKNDYNLAVFDTTFFKHIQSESLTSNSLKNGVLTTHHFIPASISGDKIATDSIAAQHIQNKAFTHGEYIVYDKLASEIYRLYPVDGGNKIVAFYENPPNTEIQISTDGGSTFTSINISENSQTFSEGHGRGTNFIVGTSTGELRISTDSASTFSSVTHTPYTSESIGFAFDQSNFFAVGMINNDLVPSKYNQTLNEFVAIKTSGSGNVVISNGVDMKPKSLHFIDGKTAYLSVRRSNAGGIVYKTSNGGASWTSIMSTAVTTRAVMDVIDDGKLWVGADEYLYKLESDVDTLKYTFSSEIRKIHFVSETLGFVLAGQKLFLTRNGGSSFKEIKSGTGNAKAFTILPNDRFLYADNVNVYEVIPQYDHQPFANLISTSFSSSNPMGEKQVAHGSLKLEDIGAGALGNNAFADNSLSGTKLQNNSVFSNHIVDLTLEGGHFEFNSIDTSKLATDGISGFDLKPRIITSEMIKDGTLDSTVIATSVLGADALGNASITTDKIKDVSFFGETLQNSAITTSKLVDNGFDSGQFTNLAFNNRNFVENAIDTSHLSASFSLENDKLATEVLSNLSISDGEINSRLINDASLLPYLVNPGTIVEAKLQNYSIDTKHFAHQSITNSMLFTNIVTSGSLATQSVSGHSFITNTISRASYSTVSIPFNKIDNLTITSRELSNDSIVAGKFSTQLGELLDQVKFTSDIVDQTKLAGQFTQQFFNDRVFVNSKFSNRPFVMSDMTSQNLTSGHFIDREILNASLANLSINTHKLSITDDFSIKLADNAINSLNIVTHTLSNANINNDLTVNKVDAKAIFSSHFGVFTDINTINDSSIRSQTIKLRSLANADLAANAIETSQIVNKTITSSKIADGFVDNTNVTTAVVNSDKIKLQDIINADFSDDTITGSKIQSLSLTGGNFVDDFLISSRMPSITITTGKIFNLTLTNLEIDENAIITRHIDGDSINIGAINANTIIASDIESQVLLSSHLENGSFTNVQIAPFAIESKHIKDHELDKDHFVNNTIESSSIDNNIPENRIALGEIKAPDLSTVSKINAVKFNANTIDAAKFQTNQITNAKITDSTVNGSQFTAGNISQSKLNSGSIETQNVMDASLDTNEIVAATLNASRLLNDTLINRNFAIDAIDQSSIIDSSVATEKLAENSITAAKLAGGLRFNDFANHSILNSHIVDKTLNASLNLGAIVNADIQANTLTWDDLNDDAITATHINDGAIVKANIVNDGVNLNKFINDTIVDRHFTDDSLTDDAFSADIPGSKFVDNTIDSSVINLTSTIGLTKITDIIEAGKIADSNVTLAKFTATLPVFSTALNSRTASNSISSVEFLAAVITGQKLNGAIIDLPALGSNTLSNTEIPVDFITSGIIGTDIDSTKVFQDGSGVSSSLISTDKLKDGSFNTSHITNGIISKSLVSSSDTSFAKIFDLGDAETHADGVHVHARPTTMVCPSGFTLIGTGDTDLCVMNAGELNMNDTISHCQNHNARVCNLKDYVTVCKNGSGNLTPGKNYNSSNFVGSTMISFNYQSNCDFEDSPIFFGINDGAGGSRSGLCCYSN